MREHPQFRNDVIVRGKSFRAAPPDRIIEDAYLSALSRFPTKSETEKIRKILRGADAKDQRAAIEDMCWAILSSKEFLFNH